jgi:antitoxin component YwqK of YwqJK toxin-antitoxin module
MRSIDKLIKNNWEDRLGRKQGCWEYYYPDGQLECRGSFKNGKRIGVWEEYWSNGNLWIKGSYLDGQREGIWEYYYSYGSLNAIKVYENGIIVEMVWDYCDLDEKYCLIKNV